MTRGYLEAVRGIDTGLQEEGFDAFQVKLLASTFINCQQEGPLSKALGEVKDAIDAILYGGTYHSRACQLYWDNDDLLLNLKKVSIH